MTIKSWIIKKLIGKNHVVIPKVTSKTQEDEFTKLAKGYAILDEQLILCNRDQELIDAYLNKTVRGALRNRREPLSAYVKTAIEYLQQQHEQDFLMFLNLYTNDEEEKIKMMAYWRTIVKPIVQINKQKNKVD